MQPTTKITTMLLASAALFGCAKHAHEIPAQYVSPMEYNSYTCRQLETELATVSRKVSELAGQVNKTASDDTAQMTVGLLLLWPTLFFLDGDTPQAQEYARLKGEFEAIEKAANQKNCNIHVERPVMAVPQETEKKPPSRKIER